VNIKSARFIASNTKMGQLPPATLPEYAFIGRSNVGKSSLINMLTNQKKLAKTSQTPGKTQLINHFIINDNWYLVDLPGYGFAKASKTDKKSWEGFIKTYLESRENLQCVLVLIDSRLEPQKIDLEFLEWLGNKGLSFIIVFTKADKQSKQKTQRTVQLFKNEVLKNWESMPPHFVTSSEERLGREEVLQFIDEVNRNFRAPQLTDEPGMPDHQ
jgi:GTP-binding protein